MKLIKKYDTDSNQSYLGKIQAEEVGFETDKTYTYYQATPVNTWIIEHTLDKYPSVKATDLNMNEIKGKIKYYSNAEIRIEFNIAKSGYAFLN